MLPSADRAICGLFIYIFTSVLFLINLKGVLIHFLPAHMVPGGQGCDADVA